EATGSWSAFTDISGTIVYSSEVWSPMNIDISAYAGKKVRIAFYHYTNNDSYVGVGWYVDQVEIIKKAPEWTGDFECGWDDWHTDNGVWQVGTPTVGPSSCYSGTQCAGTILGGTYPYYSDSRLISPAFYLPADGVLSFSFRHWFSYYSSDYGIVQISEYDEATGHWSAFTNISSQIVFSSSVWSPMSIDISVYAGKKVRIAFYHYTNNDSYVGAGWYIDHIRIAGFPHYCECDLNQDTQCDMPDWLVFGGDWGRTDCNEVGAPPCECDLNHDGSCNMLDWLRFGENWGQSDCLICEE
ncbi:MAG: immune inhibitor A, partial [Proteobacteria bacterium]|nr:immune inhibitor A [Pseudomonadota bacterium]